MSNTSSAPVLERESERAATYPHPHPNAWYHLLDSEEVARGSAKAVNALGERFLVTRDEAGTARVLDGYCPHLGAALPEGRMKDGCISCPFHGWQIAPTGAVAHIPYAERVPKNLAVTCYPSRELDGQIFVWRAQHGSEVAPAFPLESVPDIESGALRARGTYDGGFVRMHLMEFIENGPDVHHFQKVHARLHLPWTRINVPGLGVAINPRWHLDDDRTHVAWLRTYATVSAFGRRFDEIGATADVEFLGPGSVARFHFEKPGLGKLLLYQTHTPVSPLLQRVRFRWFASDSLPRFASWWVVGHWISQWRDDVQIWESKIHRKRPHLVKEDGQILTMRKWFSRFYGETSAATPRPRAEMPY
ncbi:MAG: Rieske 2Fe-2S domain-containing protein [Deltaproteobacteria bacterium]|nr:Rieske 2Fe-2S domain-containing protein [Deltaproteobacteria bacterium]